jgi:hypothetical protein
LPDFDFDATLRWARFAPRKTLSRRSGDELPFLDNASAGQALLLDTCVYIDGLQGRTPDAVADLLDLRIVNHSAVAVQELMHSVGALDPRHPGSKVAIDRIGGLIKAMPPHRVFAPDTDMLAKGAMLSGILCRLQGYAADDRYRALHDCVLFVQAQKLGLTVLTANVGDFDLLLQMLPAGRAIFYRPL